MWRLEKIIRRGLHIRADKFEEDAKDIEPTGIIRISNLTSFSYTNHPEGKKEPPAKPDHLPSPSVLLPP